MATHKHIFIKAVLGSTLLVLLSACEVGVGVGYGPGPRCHWHHCWAAENTHLQVDSAALLSQDYGIRKDSAQSFVNLAAVKHVPETLDLLGVTEEQMAPLAQGKMPSTETIDRVSQRLGERNEVVTQVMQDYLTQTAVK